MHGVAPRAATNMIREADRPAFGQAIVQARLALGISQKALAERLGVTQSAVSSWESGDTEPPPRVAFSIENALGVPPGHLSVHLGYIPAQSADIPKGDVEGAILASPLLDERSKNALIASYRVLARREPTRRRRGRPIG